MRTNLKIWLTISLLLGGMVCKAAGQTIYVDAGATGANNGSSWVHAYKYLQDALNKPPGSGDQIWVAEGIYKPDQDEGGNVTTGDREATFQLINDVAMYGGFAGGETSRDERDAVTNVTILSGDLAGNDVPVADPCDLPTEPARAENSYNVVTGGGTDETAVLDGFTITAGNANGSYPNVNGGGMYNSVNSSPTLTNCTFSGNSASNRGGGMHNYESSPALTNCTFAGNSAIHNGGGMSNDSNSGPTLINCIFSGNWVSGSGDWASDSGGGMWNQRSTPTVTNCTFSGNSTVYLGGGMSNRSSSPTLADCTFTANSADDDGGGMWNFGSSPALTNCTFSGNWSGYTGGGMSNRSSSNPRLTNCTLTGNWAEYGGGIKNSNYSSPILTNCTLSGNSAHGGGGIWNDNSSPVLANCILWANAANNGSQIGTGIGTPVVNYSCIQGTWTGSGSNNINDDPLFVRNPDDGVDGWGDDPCTPGEDEGDNDDFGDLHLQTGSPCIDAGDNDAVPLDANDIDGDGNTTERTPLDLDGRPRFVDDTDTADTGNGTPPIVDMGAYEFPEISLITADFCGVNSDQPDGYVDYWDLLYFAQRWHSSLGDPDWDPRCDLDKEDNYVDYWDLLAFVQQWHEGEPP